MIVNNDDDEDDNDMEFNPDFRKNDQKKARGKVLSSIVEEVYETYGNNSDGDDDDVNADGQEGVMNSMANGNKQHRRVSSARTLPRMSKLLTSSSGAESPLTLQAVQFIKEFEQSRIEIIPSVIGTLYTLQLLPKKKAGKPSLKFVVLDPINGDLIMFKKA